MEASNCGELVVLQDEGEVRPFYIEEDAIPLLSRDRLEALVIRDLPE